MVTRVRAAIALAIVPILASSASGLAEEPLHGIELSDIDRSADACTDFFDQLVLVRQHQTDAGGRVTVVQRRRRALVRDKAIHSPRGYEGLGQHWAVAQHHTQLPAQRL